MKQQIIRCTNIISDLTGFLHSLSYDGLFLLTDENTWKYSLPLIQEIPEIRFAKTISIPAGDENKTVDSLSQVWTFLSNSGANRKSLLVNLGGGMLTDLGGFAAATFKRGIRFINIPTTLLGAVDAAVGGKTGINFNGLKNEIGAFFPAMAVLIDSNFFKTLDTAHLLSGYAEMLKHALLDSPAVLDQILRFDLNTVDYHQLNDLLSESVLLKERIVQEDPTEQGIRKALNLGHTFGHAFESLSHAMKHPVAHGYAVAWGLVCELYLSFVKLGFDQKELMKIVRFIKENYGVFAFDCTHYSRLYEWMQHDKKNESSAVNFTLLRAVGDIAINQTADKKDIEEVLDFYRDCFY
ncbi:MAG: 3-dehydroquinate synthase [Dysgonamonadaceae bacterium]|jgi:3-dehydroquinate synthase|nr:3-dehydroquinate synthase [Dysgonamonadaceae bacterium]